MKILLTSTSFQDTPGKHHDGLNETGFIIDTLRGPVKEDVLLPIIAKYDGVICGDDHYTRKVIEKGKAGKLKVISKYGIGLDKIDLKAALEFEIKVTNCPGVNHMAVAEHIWALILAFYKNIPDEINYTRYGKWERLIGHEIYGKKIGVAGLGRIGKEVLIRAKAFGLKLYAFDKYIDTEFVKEHSIKICNTLEKLFSTTDIISLNMNLNKENKKCITKEILDNHTKRGLLLINSARGELVDEKAIVYGIKNKILDGYLTDVLNEEPMQKGHPFLDYNNIIITPHIGSRTYESVERQGLMAVKNLVKSLLI
jgi:D-3-phosphoglycerate dehydrogenase / 2-oxoglutarate reductase